MSIESCSTCQSNQNAAQTASFTSPQAAIAGLQGQLTRCETQLSDWVHCPSSKTKEGKEIIDGLNKKIADLKDKMSQAGAAKDQQQAQGAGVAAPQTANAPKPVQAANASTASVSAEQASRRKPVNGMGIYVDDQA